MKPLRVICAIIIRNEKILVAQRSGKMSLPLKWEFPGGKINISESEEECIHRELQEELNIKVKIVKKLESSFYDYGEIKINLTPFIVSYERGKIILAEHSEVRWLSREDLTTLDWASADLLVVQQFLKIKK